MNADNVYDNETSIADVSNDNKGMWFACEKNYFELLYILISLLYFSIHFEIVTKTQNITKLINILLIQEFMQRLVILVLCIGVKTQRIQITIAFMQSVTSASCRLMQRTRQTLERTREQESVPRKL